MALKLTRKLVGMSAALMVLPILAACEQRTAEAPTEAPVAQVSPGVTASPTESPTTTAGNSDIVAVVASDPSLSTLATAITETGLASDLQSGGPYTIFAPSDQAFAALPEATRQELLQPENRDELRQLLSYHVVQGQLTSDQIRSGQVQSLEGTPLNVSVNEQPSTQVQVNNATVSRPDILATNGVIHIVDQVILPSNVSLN